MIPLEALVGIPIVIIPSLVGKLRELTAYVEIPVFIRHVTLIVHKSLVAGLSIRTVYMQTR